MKPATLLIRFTVVLLSVTAAVHLKAQQCPANHKLYVDSSGSSTTIDGSSWGTAYRNLRQALAIAATCPGIDSILVAKGTYLPAGATSGNRDTAFALLRGGLKLYGGYPSGGGNPNVVANRTILSGDIGVAGDSTDNCYHVVVVAGLSASADSLVLDGFTITGGNANGDGNKSYNGVQVLQYTGGGMVLKQNNGAGKKIVVRNCLFSDNFSDNSPNGDFGGGLCNLASSPTIANCTFSGNKSVSEGGGLGNQNSSPAISYCTFINNRAKFGGGMQNLNSFPVITNCTFSNNSGFEDGGMSNITSSPVIINCIFSGNSSSIVGGGMGNLTSSPILTNCTFSGNHGGNGGAMSNSEYSKPVITNVSHRPSPSCWEVMWRLALYKGPICKTRMSYSSKCLAT